jgi:prepilin-type N-terminal cleavage/methylation domain-containing protein
LTSGHAKAKVPLVSDKLFGAMRHCHADMKAVSARKSSGSKCAFTLIELLVVISIIAILAALLLPALVGAKRRAKLAQCQNNFHEVYAACFVYANNFNDYFPVCVISGEKNEVYAPSDTSFVVRNLGMGAHHPLPANTPVTQKADPGVFDCLGLLYETHLIGGGKILYCPGFPAGSLFGPAQFSNPSFMSTDANGWVRDSMLFNPEVVSMEDFLNPNPARRFPKTSSLIGGRLFGMDALQTITNVAGGVGVGYIAFPPPTQLGPTSLAHYPSRGFDVLWTDGSVEFVQSPMAFKLAASHTGVVIIDGKPYGLGDDDYDYAELYQLLEEAR